MTLMDSHALLWTQVIQIAIVAGVAWVAWRVFARNRPHLAHAIWAIVLIKCLTPPVFSSPTSPFSWVQQSDAPAEVFLNVREHSEAKTTPGISAEEPLVFYVPLNEERTTSVSESKSKKARHFAAITSRVDWIKRGRIWTIYLWMTGALLGVAFVAVRYWRFARLVHSHDVLHDTLAHEVLSELTKRLSIRRSVRLLVIDGAIGPAVIGAIRPTVLLPAMIVQGKTKAELAPLVAHELIHIRRGDLWWSFLQSVTKSLWWFHPMVWISSRMLTRETEQSCDEETVASLGCAPATYARSLLAVLEEKHRLRVAPALPGVRPIDVTSNRMERIMRLGHGSHRQTPIWVWGFMLIVGICVLPGAAIVTGQNPDPPDRPYPDLAIPSAPVPAPAPPVAVPPVPPPNTVPAFATPASAQAPSVLPDSDPSEAKSSKALLIKMTVMEVRQGKVKSLAKQGREGTSDEAEENGSVVRATKADPNDWITATSPKDLDERIRELVEAGDIKVIARPQIMTTEGVEAQVHIGGQVQLNSMDVQDSERKLSPSGPSSLESIGFSSSVVPRILKDGRIELVLKLEHAELDPHNSIAISTPGSDGTQRRSHVSAIKKMYVSTCLSLKPAERTLVRGPMKIAAAKINKDGKEVTENSNLQLVVAIECQVVNPLTTAANNQDAKHLPSPYGPSSTQVLPAVPNVSVAPVKDLAGRKNAEPNGVSSQNANGFELQVVNDNEVVFSTTSAGEDVAFRITGDIKTRVQPSKSQTRIHIQGTDLKLHVSDPDVSPEHHPKLQADSGVLTIFVDTQEEVSDFDDVVWDLKRNVLVSMNGNETIKASRLLKENGKMIGTDVVVDFEEFKLNADQFEWDLGRQYIRARGKVLFERPDSDQAIQAESMAWDLAKNDVEFSKVRLKLKMFSD